MEEFNFEAGNFREIKGNLITLANEGIFDVIAHGVNCFCMMGAGLAPQMANAFGADRFDREHPNQRGNINKLGNIDYKKLVVLDNGTGVVEYSPNWVGKELTVVNAYTQYEGGRNADYSAIELCMKKINHEFKGKHIGLPLIGCGIAGVDWSTVRSIMVSNLKDCKVTIVHYKP